MTGRRAAVSLALALYCLGIIALALLPWPADWLEVLVALVAAAALAGLVAQLLPMVTLPGERWAYLAVGFSGTVTLVAFEVTSQAAGWARLSVGLLLAAGVAGAFAAHLGLLARASGP